MNFNARLYNPALGVFLAVDPMATSFAGLTPYNFSFDNPTNFSDPNGECPICIVAIVGGLVNLGIKAYQGKINSWGDGFAAFGIGAAAGAVGFVTGGAAFAAAGGAAAEAGGFLAGYAGGSVGAAFALPVLNMGNVAYFNDPVMSMKEYAMGIFIGGALGGATNGFIAVANGNSFWNGMPKNGLMHPAPFVQGVSKPESLSDVDDIRPNSQTNIQPRHSANIADDLPSSRPNDVNIGRGDFVGKKITSYYPKNNGFAQQPKEIMLKAGQVVDRYGSEGGHYLAPKGTPRVMRSLRPGTTNNLSSYQVIKPFPVLSGKASPWFGQVGGWCSIFNTCQY